MAYETFKAKVQSYLRQLDIKVQFDTDEETGKYIAKCSDGTRFEGSPTRKKIFVRFGSGHCAPIPA